MTENSELRDKVPVQVSELWALRHLSQEMRDALHITLPGRKKSRDHTNSDTNVCDVGSAGGNPLCTCYPI